jgi:hypothetical protein
MKEHILIYLLRVANLVELDITLIKEIQVVLDVQMDIHLIVIQALAKYVKQELFLMIHL